MKKLDYLLTGYIDGVYTEISGKGSIDQIEGKFDLELNVHSAPAGWDPAIIILMCCDNLRFYSSKNESKSISSLREGLSSIEFGDKNRDMRKGQLIDNSGNIIVSMKAKGFLFIEEDIIKSRTIIYEGHSLLHEFGGIKKVQTPYTERIIPTITGRATGISTYKVETGNGTLLEGQTYYPYNFSNGDSLNQETILTVDNAKVNSSDFYLTKANPIISVSIKAV